MNLRQSALIGILAIMIDAPLTSAKAWALEPETGLHWEGNSSVFHGEPLLQFAQVGYGKEPQTMQVSPTQVQPVPRLQPTQPQLPSGQVSVSNEFLILQGVQRLEEKLINLDAILKALNAKLDAINAKTDGVIQKQQQAASQLDTHHSRSATLPANLRWAPVLDNTAVLDRETGLVWSLTVSSLGETWYSARSTCQINNTGGRKGWRLPSLHELTSLIDTTVQGPGSKLPVGSPFNRRPIDYWSGTISLDDPTRAWTVNFGTGVSKDTMQRGDLGIAGTWCVHGPDNAAVY
jgi:hypothetical protein